ncbi:DUF4179 domain-containing protein [Parablautia intestinalis]|jgi:hypothetical protein|uniref:DUF4179 domain-containing protein n=1 Tax=Parablautia intestinalis TaxID=2320100 RepID=A0A3A9AE74_9FIRM|nr:DUF4179 domain-containing protein [Parablautia intestinalis]MCI8614858.1 DUF4179 domain-containing protein [Lachnospiraceae bacterium]RKI89697.1 DUF4179 domain-containing protein [Parablautia intestinalis]
MTDEKLDQILKQALAPEIEDREIKVRRKVRKGKMRIWNKMGKAAAAAAVIIIGIGTLGYFNPVLAAKIPLIGRIFEKIGDDVTYSGDYTDKGNVLTNEDLAGTLDTQEYSASNQGITLTASEVYCDGYSIFLTVNIKEEAGEFTHIPKHYTDMYGESGKMAAGFYIGGTWSAGGISSEQLMNTFEGEVIDDQTFVGMLKMNFAEKFEGSGELSLNITGLGYDDERMLDAEEISASHWVDGSWNIRIPFEVNKADVRTVEVGETQGDITLHDVVVSPYQVVVHTSTPGRQRELTDDRREKLLSKDPDMTDAEMFEILGWSYEPCQTIVFNQDGEALYSDMEMPGFAGFAVQGKELSALHIFIFDNLEDWDKMREEGMSSSAADRAVIAKEINL